MENDKDISFIQASGWITINIVLYYLKILYKLMVIVTIVLIIQN
jgi:hypothetical protein